MMRYPWVKSWRNCVKVAAASAAERAAATLAADGGRCHFNVGNAGQVDQVGSGRVGDAPHPAGASFEDVTLDDRTGVQDVSGHLNAALE